MSAWMPIESVPRDGTTVIVWDKLNQVPVVARWYWCGDKSLMQGGWEADKSVYSTDHGYPIYDDVFTENVTHWMPIPDAPL